MFSSTGHSALPLPLFQAVDDSNKVLKLSKFQAINETSAKQIKANLDTLRHKTGISNKDVIHVSATFPCTYKKVWIGPGDANSTEDSTMQTPQGQHPLHLRRRVHQQRTYFYMVRSIIEVANLGSLQRRAVKFDEQVVAFCPGTINNVVPSNSLVPTPNP